MGNLILGRDVANYIKLIEEREQLRLGDQIERAARGFVDRFSASYSSVGKRIFLFAGPGITGSLTLAIALALSQASYYTETILIHKDGAVHKESELYREELLSQGLLVRDVFDELVMPEINSATDIVIDGLFGAGLSRPLEGGFRALAMAINKTHAKVISIDLPSGMLSEDNSGIARDAVIRAHETYAIEIPKLATLLEVNRQSVGALQTIHMGVRPEIALEFPSNYRLIEEKNVGMMLELFYREEAEQHPLAIMPLEEDNVGWLSLMGKSALTLGLERLWLPLSGKEHGALQLELPEATFLSDAVAYLLEHRVEQLPDDALYSLVGQKAVEGSLKAVLGALSRKEAKAYIFSGLVVTQLFQDQSLLEELPRQSILIATKADLALLDSNTFGEYGLFERVQKIATRYGITIICLGLHAMVCLPRGEVYINELESCSGLSGYPAAAMLAGSVGALLARGMSLSIAPIVSVYLVTLSGYLTRELAGAASLRIGKVIDNLPRTLRQLSA